MTAEELITDEQLDIVCGNIDLGGRTKRDMLNNALLKAVCGYANGSTMQCIIQELGLVGKSMMKGNTATKKGKEYLFAVFGKYGY